jgi:hypothetical protein
MYFLKYFLKIDVMHQDVLIRLFFLSLETRQKEWVKHILSPKSISSLTKFIHKFLKRWAPRMKSYENTLHDLTVALQREVLSSNLVEEYKEPFDETSVFVPRFDEVIQDSIPLAHEEER